MTVSRRALAGSSLTLLSLVLIAFVLDVAVLSGVQHARSQRVAYAQLRVDLAAATAPTGQLDNDGKALRPGSAITALTVPDLGLTREVVFEGTTSSTLAKGPGHLRSSVMPGQPGTAVLLGRAWSYGGPFGGADKLAKGSLITVTTGQGTHTYTVTGVRRPGDAVPALAEGKGRLTLVTATGTRLAPDGVSYVDAELTSSPVPAPARAFGAASLSAAELPLESDSSAWPVAVLLLQGFALSALLMAWATRRFGRAPAWCLGVPVAAMFFVLSSREVTHLLPNLL